MRNYSENSKLFIELKNLLYKICYKVKCKKIVYLSNLS